MGSEEDTHTCSIKEQQLGNGANHSRKENKQSRPQRWWGPGSRCPGSFAVPAEEPGMSCLGSLGPWCVTVPGPGHPGRRDRLTTGRGLVRLWQSRESVTPTPTAALPPKTRALPCMAPSGSLFSWLGLFCHEPIVVTSNCLKCLTWTFVPLGRPANFSSLSP